MRYETVIDVHDAKNILFLALKSAIINIGVLVLTKFMHRSFINWNILFYLYQSPTEFHFKVMNFFLLNYVITDYSLTAT